MNMFLTAMVQVLEFGMSVQLVQYSGPKASTISSFKLWRNFVPWPQLLSFGINASFIL